MASTIAQTSLDGKDGVGATVDFTDARRNVSAVLSVSGVVAEGVVVVEASQDAVNWVTRHLFPVHEDSVQGYDSMTGAYRYWRASATRPVSGGGTVKVTFMEGDR